VREGDGRRCTVVVGDDDRVTSHEVTVSDRDLRRLARGGSQASDAERLVAASFAFLLEREPREAILRTFDLTVIARYFPDYEQAIARYLQGR
jgi:hypothetical protein